MAKGKKSKSAPKTSAAAVSQAPKQQDVPEIVKRTEIAYDLGNHAAVRSLAGAAAADHLDGKAQQRVDQLLEMTRTDPVAWAIGVGAFVLAVIVAIATLGG